MKSHTRPISPFIVKWTSLNGFETLPNATSLMEIQFTQTMLQNMACGQEFQLWNSEYKRNKSPPARAVRQGGRPLANGAGKGIGERPLRSTIGMADRLVDGWGGGRPQGSSDIWCVCVLVLRTSGCRTTLDRICVNLVYSLYVWSHSFHHNMSCSLKCTLWYRFVACKQNILHLFYQCRSSSIRLAVCAFSSAPALSIHSLTIRGLHLFSLVFLLTPSFVPICAQSCFHWGPPHLRG
jgi:hypothetical protein